MTNHYQNNDSEMINLLNIRCSIIRLQIKCGTILNYINNNRARYYFQYGLNRRLLIIAKNFDFFYSTISPNREKPLEDNERDLATVHLNSLYINLCGAIDNIAWILTYEFNLYPDIINIEVAKQKHEINLFHQKFLLRIEKINDAFEEYKKYLSTKNTWYQDLLKFRHPSTHRIPLYVPPSILNKSESEKYIYHQAQHLEEANKLNFKEADAHLNYINAMGIFNPLFGHDPDIELSPIYPTITTDCGSLAEITDKFLASLTDGCKLQIKT